MKPPLAGLASMLMSTLPRSSTLSSTASTPPICTQNHKKHSMQRSTGFCSGMERPLLHVEVGDALTYLLSMEEDWPAEEWTVAGRCSSEGCLAGLVLFGLNMVTICSP